MWSACEDLQLPGGSIALVPHDHSGIEWFNKGYHPYGTNWTDDKYYLGLGKAAVATAGFDLLGDTVLCTHTNSTVRNGQGGTVPCEPTWELVEKAVPPIRVSGKGQ